MQDFAAIDFEGYGMNIRCINFTACLPHHVNALTPPSHQFHLSAATCGFNMENHHKALADAKACA